ncbi:hypothetical protein M378DRAFT_120886 [Amanita muscaria Koide BX008]|uniref:Arrestin C-terminal-like domain-containing protein n=1 Tax=Amanita muscaria (strain Koide BX008) TaxID=946122 RepID=A0A0C2SYM2_AMAMK|nr:hypothetical protein M378DRAFT_120886 [Amanita muscaria Koide BX008]
MNLVLSSTRGKQGLRHFPHSGFLGLTPVQVDGSVSVSLDPRLKSLKAKSLSVSVRCYESRQGPLFPSRSNILADYTQLLWSKPDHLEYDSMSDLEFPFLITLPVDAPGFSTTIFVDYRCIWRIEAVLEHAPIYGVGSFQSKHFDLALIRCDVPPHQPTPPRPVLNSHTNKPKAPRLSYCIHSSTVPIGPGDLLSIPVYLQPLDLGVIIRTVTLTVERRIRFKENGHTSIPQRTRTMLASSRSQPISPSFYHEHDHIDTSSTAALIPQPHLSKRPSTAPAHSSPASNSHKTISDLVAGAEPSGRFSKDKNGIWSTVLSLQWPAARSHSKWAIGETIQSNLVSVQFFVHVKVIVSSPTGVDSIELAEKELLVVSTGDEERQLALSKYASRRSHEPRTTSSAQNTSKTRRPHTSAGTRDRVNPRTLERMDSPSVVVSTPMKPPRTAIEREWEEELARIEKKSRRFSDLLGFPWKKKR